MRKRLSFYADIIRMCYGATLIRLFPNRGILGLSQQAWQILLEVVNSESSGLAVSKCHDGVTEYFTLTLFPSKRDFWVSEEWLLLDDLANLERLGLIRLREQLSGCDRDYYATRKGVRYALYLPKLPPKPPSSENPPEGSELDDFPYFPPFPPMPPAAPDENPEAVSIDSIEINR